MAIRSFPNLVSDMLLSCPPPLGLDIFDFHDPAMDYPSILFATVPPTNETSERKQLFDLGDLETEFFTSMDPQSWSSDFSERPYPSNN